MHHKEVEQEVPVWPTDLTTSDRVGSRRSGSRSHTLQVSTRSNYIWDMRLCLIGVLVCCVLAAVAGCGESPAQSSSQKPASPSVSTPPPTSEPYATLSGALGRCGPQPAEVSKAGFHFRVLNDRRVGTLPAVTAGHGRTVVVLLHQTDGDGFCGWLPFAARIVEDPSLTVIAVDLCGYGQADCRGASSSTDAASVAINAASRDLHARRIVVVGASMGGSIALIAAVNDRRVDAAVDLSGPVDWPGMKAVRGGRALPVPVLVAMADSESQLAVRGAHDIVTHAPAGSRFIEPSAGHGYELLFDPDDQPGPLAAPLLAWLTR